HLVALQAPDEVPDGRRLAISQLARLGDQLLRSVLAVVALSTLERGRDRARRHRLRHRDEGDVVRVATGAARRALDARAHIVEIRADLGHVSTATVTCRPVTPSRR